MLLLPQFAAAQTLAQASVQPTTQPAVQTAVQPAVQPAVQLTTAAETQSYMLCKSRHASHYNEECILVNASGARIITQLTTQLFNSNDWQAHNGILRTAIRVPDTHAGEWIYGYINAQGIQLDLDGLYNNSLAKEKLAKLPNRPGLPEQATSQKFPRMRDLAQFSDGLASVCHNAYGCGYINPQGSWALAPRADWAQANDFHHGLALVRGPSFITNPGPISSIGPMHIKPPWSVINKAGQIVMGYDPAAAKAYQNVPFGIHGLVKQFALPKINIQSDFTDGVAMFSALVGAQGSSTLGYGLVDTQGHIVLPANKKYSREDALRAAYASLLPISKKAAVDKRKWFRTGDTFQLVAKIAPFRWSPKKEYYANGVEIIDHPARWRAEAAYESKKLNIVTPFQNGFAVVELNSPNHGKTEALMNQAGQIIVTYAQLVKAANPDKP